MKYKGKEGDFDFTTFWLINLKIYFIFKNNAE